MSTPKARTAAGSPLPTDRPVRVALVGCGRISKSHFDALDAHKVDAAAD